MRGEYLLVECIGERTGLVFRAQRRRDGVALIVRVFPGLDPDSRDRLLEFAARAGRVRHPALASVSASGTNGDDVFVVEELIEGRSLAALCERAGIPPLSRSVDLVLQLARALESAHRSGVAHDSLCPRNVLLRGGALDGSVQLQAKLVDLGVPAFVRAWPPPLESALYMAPEQLAKLRIARARDHATASMNVYSLGALLYDLCTGGPPFAASSVDELGEAHATAPVMPPSRINPQIPSTLDTALLRALAKDPAQRFANMGELIEALTGLRLTTGVSGVQPVFVNTQSQPPRAPLIADGATFHGRFDERPTSKTELPPPRTPSQRPSRGPDAITERPPPPPAAVRDEDETALHRHAPRPSGGVAPAGRGGVSFPPLGSFTGAPPPEHASTAPARGSVPPRRSSVPPARASQRPSRAPQAMAPGSQPPPRSVSGEPAVSPAASIELLRTTQPPHVQLLEHANELGSQLKRSLRGRGRLLPLALLALCLAGALSFWRASRVPLPAEHVHTTSLAPLPDSGARSLAGASEQARPRADSEPLQAVARVSAREQEPLAAEVEDETPERPEHGSRGPRTNARSTARPARASEPRPPANTRADASAPIASAYDLAPEASRLTSETARVEAEPAAAPSPEQAPAPAPEREPVQNAPPPPVARAQPMPARPAPAPVARPSAPLRPPRARIAALNVRGSLPSSQVTQGIERVVPQLNECARAAATPTGQPLILLVAFELDEHGRARNPRVSGGGSPGLRACVSAATGRIASRAAPDTGTVAASFQLVYAP